jgi:hypothetical protein
MQKTSKVREDRKRLWCKLDQHVADAMGHMKVPAVAAKPVAKKAAKDSAELNVSILHLNVDSFPYNEKGKESFGIVGL